MKCQKPFSEEMGFVKERRTYTKRLATKIVEEVLADDLISVARKGVVTTEEIERMLKEIDMQRKTEKRTVERKIKLAKSQKEKLEGKKYLSRYSSK